MIVAVNFAYFVLRICSTFNNHICELVATSATEDVATCKVLLSAMEDLIKRLVVLAKRVYDDDKSNTTPCGIFAVARACICLLDVYPAIGATVVTATAGLLAEESKNAP